MSDPFLLDINVLVALAWKNHQHHETAESWFLEHAAGGWCTCPSTESGFVRISSNRSIFSEARSPSECVELLSVWRSIGRHQFLDDAVSFLDSRWIDAARLRGHRQVPDAHLLAVALSHGAVLATFDRAIRFLVPPPFRPEDSVATLASESVRS